MSNKSPEMMAFLNGMTGALFGRSLDDCFLNGICVACHGPVKEDDFKTRISQKEYTISGMCQECQDKTFVESYENR